MLLIHYSIVLNSGISVKESQELTLGFDSQLCIWSTPTNLTSFDASTFLEYNQIVQLGYFECQNLPHNLFFKDCDYVERNY